jgi:hypothetical protein
VSQLVTLDRFALSVCSNHQVQEAADM